MKKLFFYLFPVFAIIVIGLISCEKAELPSPNTQIAGISSPDQININGDDLLESRDVDCLTCQEELPTEGIGTNIANINTANIFFNYWADNCFEQECPRLFYQWTNSMEIYNPCVINDPTNQLLGGVLFPEELPIVMNKIGCHLAENLPSPNHLVKKVTVSVYNMPSGGRCMSVYAEYAICSPIIGETPDPDDESGIINSIDN